MHDLKSDHAMLRAQRTGYLITLPIMASSLAGGYLYAANPAFPWYVAGATMALALVVTIFFIRDPQRAEA